MATQSLETLDPETRALLQIRLKSQPSDDADFRWDTLKENVRPLKRGRNVKILNDALHSHSNLPLKHSLLITRRKLIEAIDEYRGDDPLLPWLECIKWVQEAFPAGGDSSGLVLMYEQCVRAFWHDDRYKNDHRYLKVWLEYAESCSDAEVIYRFLEANNIGLSHAAYYISYALHLEKKHKIKTANEVFNRGLSINAQPLEKLEAAYRKFIARSMGKSKTATDEDGIEISQPVRSFGTVLSRGENRRRPIDVSDVGKKNIKGNRGERIPLTIFTDTNRENNPGHQADLSKVGLKPWDSLPTHRDRNKENTAIPAKWTSFKVPQRPGSRIAVLATPAIEVFVDQQSSELHQTGDETRNTANLQLKERDEHELKRESELLKENPLRNFPMSSFPR
ncbi:hypothetical protein RND81_01G108700 [Saponaria officinalis]|uniref:BUB1 N-terminal domain-containing protein n=1 Tax=Saponaria officinalis TaxID=3572 RepID=A0AAW1NDN6_SAPOF